MEFYTNDLYFAIEKMDTPSLTKLATAINILRLPGYYLDILQRIEETAIAKKAEFGGVLWELFGGVYEDYLEGFRRIIWRGLGGLFGGVFAELGGIFAEFGGGFAEFGGIYEDFGGIYEEFGGVFVGFGVVKASFRAFFSGGGQELKYKFSL